MGESTIHRLRVELTGRRLAWNVFYYGTHLGLFAYGWHKQSSDPRLAALNKLRFSVWISRGAGLCLGYDGALILLPVLRNLVMVIRPQLTWLMPLDENLWFHRQIAYAMLFFTVVHTTAHYVNFINVERSQVRTDLAWGIHYTMPGGFTGHVMLLIMILMYTTAHQKIRHQCFEAFWYTHHLAFFFLLGLYTHATGCFVRGALPGEPVDCLGYQTWRVTIWGGIAYFVERVWREIRGRRKTNIVGVLMHPSGAMEVRFDKPSFKYKAGQWLFFNCPDVSIWQYHPFTISSAPDDPYISVHIRLAGDWTKALAVRLGATAAIQCSNGKDGSGHFVEVGNSGLALPTIRIDGPFGAPAEDVFEHDAVVLVGTGIGVTPFASILKNIWYASQNRKLGALRRVEFIWINRTADTFAWFQELLKRLEEQQGDADLLRIHTYLTAKFSEDDIWNVTVNDAGQEFDAITTLKSRTQFGRPNWARIFASIRTGAEAGTYLPGRESSLKTSIGVFYCGPNPLAKQIKQHVIKANKDSMSVKFGFYKEHF